jgi:hypothetical protein
MVATKRNTAWNKVLQQADSPAGEDRVMASTFWSTRFPQRTASVFPLPARPALPRPNPAKSSNPAQGDAQ